MENHLNPRLPVGYRFDPTDDVLVDAYLKRKIFSQPLPVDVVPELDVFQVEPWRLPKGDEKIFTDRQYFWFNTRGRDLESQDWRVAGNGQWRMSKKGKDVPIPGDNQLIGKKNTLIFWKEQGVAAAKETKWVMHEFRLEIIASPTRMSHLAMYRIFQKKGVKKVRHGPHRRGGRNAAIGGMNSGSTADVIDLNEESGSFSGPPPMTPSLSEGSDSGENYIRSW